MHRKAFEYAEEPKMVMVVHDGDDDGGDADLDRGGVVYIRALSMEALSGVVYVLDPQYVRPIESIENRL